MFTSSCRASGELAKHFAKSSALRTQISKPPARFLRRALNTTATMSGWAGKQVPSFDVTMVSSNGTIGAKMPLSAMLGKPVVIHLYNGG